MTKEEKSMIEDLRTQGLGYTKIAQKLGLSVNTVKSYCRRNLSGSNNEQETLKVHQDIRGISGKFMNASTVKDILKNELYIGDLVLQKSYCLAVGKKKRNYGEAPQYVVQDDHEAIISRELFEKVAVILRAYGYALPNTEDEDPNQTRSRSS